MTFSIGVDVGGTKILAGLVDVAGNVVGTARRPTPRNDATEVLNVVSEVVRELVTPHEGSVVGVGLGVAGPVDASRATVFFAPNLGWSQVPVRAILESRVGMPVVVENDGNAAAWGEFCFGAGSDVDELTVVTVGTGIGGGIIINGELLRGAHGALVRVARAQAVDEQAGLHEDGAAADVGVRAQEGLPGEQLQRHALEALDGVDAADNGAAGEARAPGGGRGGDGPARGKVVREAGAMKHGSTVIAFIEDPDGYKIELIQKK